MGIRFLSFTILICSVISTNIFHALKEIVDNPTGTELQNCIIKLAEKFDHCEEKSESEKSEMALGLIKCYAKEPRGLIYMCKGSENCFQTIPSIEDKVAYEVSLQKHSELCLVVNKISKPDRGVTAGINIFLQHVEQVYQSHLIEELAQNNAKYIATKLKMNSKSDQQTEKMEQVLTDLIQDEKCYNVSEAVTQNINFKEDKRSKVNHIYTETKDFKNDHEIGLEFLIFYLLLLIAITILNMRDSLLRAAAIVLRTWVFAIIIEIVIRLLPIIIESVASLFTMTGLKLIMILVRVFTIAQIIHYYRVAIRKERRAQRKFAWQQLPEAFNNNIAQNRELYYY